MDDDPCIATDGVVIRLDFFLNGRNSNIQDLISRFGEPSVDALLARLIARQKSGDYKNNEFSIFDAKRTHELAAR